MLARFEQLMEQALEGSLRRVFSTPLQPAQLAKAAARAMEHGQIVGMHGAEVPNEYELHVSPTDFDRFGDYAARVADQVKAYLIEYAHERGVRLLAEPHVQLMVDGALGAGRVRARARFAHLSPTIQRDVDAALSDTRRLRLAAVAAARAASSLATQQVLRLVDDAGLRFALEPQLGIVRLGRAADNDVVLASQRVSRYHAQLRWVESTWLVYDLESTNGTWLGGSERVLPAQPRALEPGARLRLGDYALEVRTDAAGAWMR